MTNGLVASVPSGWSLTPIGDLLTFKNGLNKGKAFFGYGTPIVNYMDVFNHSGLRISNVKGLVDVSSAEKKAFSARKGDVLFTRTSETPEEVGMSAVLLDDIENAVFSGFVLRGRPTSPRLTSSYARYCFSSSTVRGQIISSATYTTRALTNGRILSKVLLPLPEDPKEQTAIAEALSDADALIEGLERLIAKKRLIKQGAMQDLLTAKRRLPGFSGEWSIRKFGEIARIRNQKVQTFGDTRAEKCIELEQIEGETGRLRFWTSASERTTSKYLFAPGDVLFGRLRPYLRKYFLAASEGVCSTEVWPLMGIGVTSNYLYHVVQSDPFVAAACESYGTHMPRADWGKLLTFELNVPGDSDEQNAIGSVLLDMDTEIQALETRLDKARQVKEGMMQNLLTGRIRLV